MERKQMMHLTACRPLNFITNSTNRSKVHKQNFQRRNYYYDIDHRTKYKLAGFTLIEVLLVLAILVVMAGFVTVNIMSAGEEANKKNAKVQIASLAQLVRMYQLNVGSLPSSLDALYTQPADLQDVTKWSQVSDKPIPPDPWNRAYEFKIDGSKFEIRSVGPDGQSNTPDDIVS